MFCAFACCCEPVSLFGSNCFRWAAIKLPVGRLGTAGLGPLAGGLFELVQLLLLLVVVVVEFRISCDDDEMADELEELRMVVLESLFSLLVLPPTLVLHAGESSCIPVTWKPIGGGRFGIPGGGCVGFSSTAGLKLRLLDFIEGDTDGDKSPPFCSLLRFIFNAFVVGELTGSIFSDGLK